MRKLLVLETCNEKKYDFSNLPPKFEGISGQNNAKMVFFRFGPNRIWLWVITLEATIKDMWETVVFRSLYILQSSLKPWLRAYLLLKRPFPNLNRLQIYNIYNNPTLGLHTLITISGMNHIPFQIKFGVCVLALILSSEPWSLHDSLLTLGVWRKKRRRKD